MKVNKLVMVYDADAGIRGEVSYLLGMMRGRHCAPCDITHSGIRRKGAFSDLTCSLGVEVDVLHRNQQPAGLAEFTAGMGAVVVAETDAGPMVLLDDAELAACDGDVGRFAEALTASLATVDTAG